MDEAVLSDWDYLENRDLSFLRSSFGAGRYFLLAMRDMVFGPSSESCRIVLLCMLNHFGSVQVLDQLSLLLAR